MYVSINKFIRFQNFFSLLSNLCQRNGYNTSHFQYLHSVAGNTLSGPALLCYFVLQIGWHNGVKQVLFINLRLIKIIVWKMRLLKYMLFVSNKLCSLCHNLKLFLETSRFAVQLSTDYSHPWTHEESCRGKTFNQMQCVVFMLLSKLPCNIYMLWTR